MKIVIVSHPHVIPNLDDFFLLWNTKEDILVTIDFLFVWEKKYPQNILFYVPQKKKSHTGLEQHESKSVMTVSIFG